MSDIRIDCSVTRKASLHSPFSAIAQELKPVSPWLSLIQIMARFLPVGRSPRLRAAIYRMGGASIGKGALLAGALTLGSASNSFRNIRVGARCFLNSHIFMDAAAPITIGDGVSIGHHVVIITSDHAIGPPEFRAGELRCLPVTIENGAWIAAGVTLLPGVTVGAGAVVAAGAVVTKDGRCQHSAFLLL
jgi:acetyltransferase-like isoleucine patch superfamily enzyme